MIILLLLLQHSDIDKEIPIKRDFKFRFIVSLELNLNFHTT